jgi:metal-responsive CopG/Arc/MetJ family transcriptional regulator
MGISVTRSQDKKVTVSIDAHLLSIVDSYVSRHPQTSRSGIFEEALKHWYRQQLEQADVQYYSTLTESEKSSNKSWDEITTHAAQRIFP